MKAVPDKAAVLIVGDMDSFRRSGRGKCWPTSSRQALCPWFA
jgi:hypothetical protein